MPLYPLHPPVSRAPTRSGFAPSSVFPSSYFPPIRISFSVLCVFCTLQFYGAIRFYSFQLRSKCLAASSFDNRFSITFFFFVLSTSSSNERGKTRRLHSYYGRIGEPVRTTCVNRSGLLRKTSFLFFQNRQLSQVFLLHMSKLKSGFHIFEEMLLRMYEKQAALGIG